MPYPLDEFELDVLKVLHLGESAHAGVLTAEAIAALTTHRGRDIDAAIDHLRTLGLVRTLADAPGRTSVTLTAAGRLAIDGATPAD